MISRKKYKNFVEKHNIKVILLILLPILILLAILILFQSNLKLEHIKQLSIPDIAQLLRYKQTIELKDEINSILEQKFRSKNCLELEFIDMNYHDPYYSDVCDYEVFWHYVEVKVRLGKEKEIDEQLIQLLNRTYNEYKPFYASKEKLHPNDNKWNHIMNAMIKLNLLSEKEREFWINKYSSLRLDENEPKVPQTWNRIWMLRALGINNVDELIEDYNLSTAYGIVCNYVPTKDDVIKENIFNEPEYVMFSKYITINKFCGQR